MLLTRHCFCLLKSRNTSATAKYPSLSASPMPTLRRVGKLVQVAGPGPEIRITPPRDQQNITMPGIRLSACANDGVTLCLIHPGAWICGFFAQTDDESRKCWIFGQHFPFTYMPTIPKHRHCQVSPTSLTLSSSTIVCVQSPSTVFQIYLLKEFAAVDVPFPALTELYPSRFVLEWICPSSAITLVVGHSVSGITKTTFVNLDLWDIPRSGYISPDAMVTGLSTFTSLQILVVQFRSLQSQPSTSPHTCHPPRSHRV